MLKRLLPFLTILLPLTGCEYGENISPFLPWNLDEVRSRLEREKREFLKIEDLGVGNGPIAAWGRRLKANVEIRYLDGTIVYKGPIVTYFGFDRLLPDYLQDRFMLDWITQPGIQLGLNGMAVGGRRQITINRELVCEGREDSTVFGPAGCYLLRVERHFVNEIPVRKDTLVVEATLTESCAPIRLRVRPGGTLTLADISAGCRTKDYPFAGGADWHIY